MAVALIGAGRVGRAVGRALVAHGHTITGVTAGSLEGARRAAADLNAPGTTIEAAVREVDLVVIAVPDDVLAQVVERVGTEIGVDTTVIHTSGRSGAAVLAPCGSRVAAIHPARPIAGETDSLGGVRFGVTCSDDFWPSAVWLVEQLGGTAVRIAEQDRALYHAALVIASNFVVGLAGDAIDLVKSEIVVPLLRAALDNIEAFGPDAALTGPVVRGDAGTIRAHLEAIDASAPELRDAYVANSRRLLARALAAGRIDEVAATAIREALGEGRR